MCFLLNGVKTPKIYEAKLVGIDDLIEISSIFNENIEALQLPIKYNYVKVNNKIPVSKQEAISLINQVLISQSKEGLDFSNISNDNAKLIANAIATIQGGYIEMSTQGIGDAKFKLLAKQQDAPDEVFEIKDNGRNSSKLYLKGNPKYNFETAQDWLGNTLAQGEYYALYYEPSNQYGIQKLFGGTLGALPQGTKFGSPQDNKGFYIQIYKRDMGQILVLTSTNIEFVNNTTANIKYSASANYAGVPFTDTDSVIEYYTAWNYIYLHYSANLINESRTIECKAYNADTNQLLTTGYLNANQNNENIWGGGQLSNLTNVRIECNFQ